VPVPRRLFGLAPLLVACASTGPGPGLFPDRPAAWQEHDDEDVPRAPAASSLGEEKVALFIRDFFTREADRRLSLERPAAAGDVNALDEVPCSTWFCPRNHLTPLSLAEVVTGPAEASPPQLPLTISSGKSQGVAPGFVVRDARGRKYLVKLDPAGHLGLASSAEVLTSRLFHAAGYHVPGAFVIDVRDSDLRIRPDARFQLSPAAERPFTAERLSALLRGAARGSEGALRGVAVPWIPGKVLGAFDMYGRRADDPNDRLPHQDRRSLRASFVLIAWLNIEDASAINTLDSYVEEGGRRFVRHYFIDFGDSLGSASVRVKGVFHGREHLLELDRVLLAAVSLGAWTRPWQQDAPAWRAAAGGRADAGWMYPVDGWRPDEFRTGRKNPAHLRMTARDAYWGAKLVTSFSDLQIAALVDAAGYQGASARELDYALRVRRDRIGERYLTPLAAVERPRVSDDGRALCFEDLALARGFLPAGTTRHQLTVRDPQGAIRHQLQAPAPAPGVEVCLPLGAAVGARYSVASVETVVGGWRSAPSRVHLRSRAGRLAVVGLERDEESPATR
jgi:hypothetical protein